MATFNPDASDVFRDHNTKFVPSSGAYNPAKSYIRTYLKQMEEIVSALATADNFQGAWDASTGFFPSGAQEGYSWIASTPGTVGGKYFGEGDQLVALVNGASTSTYAGNWVVIPAWTSGVVAAVDAGAGTANAIQITTEKPVSDDTIVVFTLDTSTTGSPVTVSINGGTALTLKSNRGNNASALTAGMEVWGRIRTSDSTFRLLNDQDVSALVAQAEAARDEAVAAAEALDLPIPTVSDEGKLLGVDSSGDWVLVENNSVPNTAVKFYSSEGGIADATEVTATASIATGSSTLSATGASFVSEDVGKNIWIAGAGASGEPLETTIASYVSATQITLADTASTTLSSASTNIVYGTDQTTVMNDALLGGDINLFVDAGTYYVSGPVRLYENTKITFHPAARIILTGTSFLANGEVGNSSYSSGYDGPGNLHIEGGHFDMALPRPDTSTQAAFIQIAHARDVLISNIKMTSAWNGHFIELNAVKKGRVRDCFFGGQSLAAGASGREAINIDFSYETGFPLFGSWDGTVCDDILIDGCESDGVQVFAGSHGATEPTPHQNAIKILNNTIRNSEQYAIWGRYWQGAIVSGNLMDDIGEQGVLFNTCENLIFKNNKIKDAGSSSANHAIQLQTCTGSIVDDNVVTGATHTYALRMFGGSGNVASTQNLAAGTSGVTHISETDAEINGAYNATIADDAVWILPVPLGMTQGAVSIQTRSASAGTVHALYWFRVNTTAAMTLIARPSGDTNASTTGVLTGTTGADGIMTVSAHTNGNLYIENRSGSGKVVDVQFLGAIP